MVYLSQFSPDIQQADADTWMTAEKIQSVDYEPDSYIKGRALDNAAGKLSFDELGKWLEDRIVLDEREAMAEAHTYRIARLLSEPHFENTADMLMFIHGVLFEGFYSDAGKLRNRDILHSEAVIRGEAITHTEHVELETVLEAEMQHEAATDYSVKNNKERVIALSDHVSKLYKIGPFSHANAKIILIYLICYMKHLGLYINHDLNMKYFRYALIRAVHDNILTGIRNDRKYLLKFIDNLGFGGRNHLREMDIVAK